MNKSYKKDRLQKELQRLLNAIFNGGIADDRLSGIDITYVKLAPDQSFLKVFFISNNPDVPLETIQELLIKSSGYIKKQIAGEKLMRNIPQIAFEHDPTPQRVEKIEQIFKTIASEKRNNNYYDDDNDNEYYQDDELEDDDLEDNDEDMEEDIDIDDYEDVDEDDDEEIDE